MVRRSNICSSVEGLRLDFNTRQFYSKTPVIDKFGKKIFPFKLGINGYVEIVKPLDNPKVTAYASTSLVDTGDAVQGGSIDGWSSKPIGRTEVKKTTGTHSAELGSLKGHSYAHVESSHRDHLQSEDIQARHPETVVILNPLYGATKDKEQIDQTPA